MENLNTLKARVQQLLKRSLVLSFDIRREVLSRLPQLSANQIRQILAILEDLDRKQDKALEEKLKEDPFFFSRLEFKIYLIMHEEFERREAPIRKQADKFLEEALKHIPSKKIELKTNATK